VTEQVDALETLGYDPVAYLVVPRILAGVLMFPIVVGAAMFVGLGAGWAASLGLLDMSTSEFLKGARLFFDGFDVRYGLVKSASFGFAVTVLGCTNGLRAKGGAQGVGSSATQAVVQSAVMILVLRCLLGGGLAPWEGSMKRRSNDWIVGATIIVVMVGIVFSTLFLQQAEFGKKPELMTARFRDVGGVQVGNAVVIRGDKILSKEPLRFPDEFSAA